MRHEAITLPTGLICQRKILWNGLPFFMMVGLVVLLSPLPSEGTSTTRILSSGDGIELLIDGPNGQYKDILPLYNVKGVPYFSAGVGQEEREATYPLYSLKLEFLIKGGAYTGLVDLVLKRNHDQEAFHIPKEHSKGPWLFVNLPPGVYSITGVRPEGTQSKSTIEVVSGLVTTVQLIWDE